MPQTKIIATIGPSSKDYATMKNMALQGCNIFRINTKYGNLKQYKTIMSNANKINRNLHKKCEILIDVKNTKLLGWLQKQTFQYLAVAFANTVQKVFHYKKLLNRKNIKIISKIETKEALHNIKELINCSYGIMVARGDLGKNVPLAKLPLFQKEIIAKCNNSDRFVITATEMLLSMQFNKVPERAEVSDVANAVLDGSNAVMLSEETAIGKHPVECVKMMISIIRETENWENKKRKS
ncbi:MAG: hypothetical protein COT14_03290 [Candidatus Diapherotrites archaeon CG08_land_8_20_14_0_20_30_16]|nr:MAG: hypothetical protein COT14_03290 [Candidatus Diapherotrites archaeon CG08_land_8_20_14_0_20_30_16]